MTKEDIIKRIRQEASKRGGRVSYRVFLDETGIKDKWLRGQQWWAGWNALLLEAGLETRLFRKPSTPLDAVVEVVASLVVQLGRWPTDDDFRRARSRDKSFPSLKVVSRFRSSGALAEGIIDLAEREDRFAAALPIAKARATEESTVSATPKVKGYVYMIRSGRRFKIGKETTAGARQAAAGTWLENPEVVHRITTEDPDGVERYWHARFKQQGKHVKGELFALSAYDVAVFKRWKKIV